MDGCLKLKRYYCQLNSLLHRFPLLAERPLLTFSWRDAYSNTVVSVSDLRWEMSVILYNLAALHAQLGSEEARTTPESLKLACTHFQCAAGALEMFKERGAAPEMADLCSDLIMFMSRLCLAQAQECILEKSIADHRKPGIVAKVTSQIVNYYNSALALIIASGDDGLMADVVGSKQFKDSKRYLSFKISYLSAVLYLYQGQAAEEAKRFGERVTLCQLACDKLEEARKEAKGMAGAEQLLLSLAATQEIVEERRKLARNENEFIYHEEVPDISTISAVQGANLVNGIVFSVTDGELLGTDIFQRLVPMKAHEGSSVYSEEKAQLLRTLGTKIEDRDAELTGFMSSLNMEFLQFDQATVTKLPQAIVDRCASLNARPNAIPDLVALMSQLAENCGDVELLLREIKQIFAEEEIHEKAYQKAMGQRPTVHLSELNREYQKYQEAHNKAGESNETLRKAMGLHVANLRTLSKPMAEIQALVPSGGRVGGGGAGESNENPHFAELRKLLNKVTEMRGQRTQLVEGLREAIAADDITSKIVAWGDREMGELFRQEMSKHEKAATLIDMNLVAQGNILKALTDCYAKCASAIKQMSDTKHKRDQFYSALVASYDVYEDLLGKSAKGLEFYRKLHSNVAKLLTRVKAARDVQSEERQQRLNSTVKVVVQPQVSGEKGNVGPKLRDYMKAGGGFVPPSVRPSPLGSENTTTSTCVTATATDKFSSQTMTVAATTMQYGSDNTVGGGNNNFNQQQQSHFPSTQGAGGGGSDYYTATQQPQQPMTGYGQQQQQQVPQGQNTGYVNPIYQTASYGQNNNNYNYSAISGGSGNASTTTTSVPAITSHQPAVLNSVTNATISVGYSTPNPSLVGYASTQPYSQAYTSTGVIGGHDVHYANSGMSTSYQMGQQQNLSNYQQGTNAYSNAQHSSIATGLNNSSVTTTATTPTGTSQHYGQYSGYPSQQLSHGTDLNTAGGYSNNINNNNQYATSGSSSLPAMSSTVNSIPQVAQQMSQMSVLSNAAATNTSQGGVAVGYGNYYGTQSQYTTAATGYPNNNSNINNTSTNVNQPYYGQTGATVQYSQQQPQYGSHSSDISTSAGGGSSQYSMGGGGATQQQQQQQSNPAHQGQFGQYATQYGTVENNWNNSSQAVPQYPGPGQSSVATTLYSQGYNQVID